MGRARGKKEKGRERGPWLGCQEERAARAGERRERREAAGRLGWAQGREKRGKREKNKTKSKRAFEFELKFELKFNPNKLQPMKQCKEHEMHKHMVFPIFILYLRRELFIKIL
jgi:hypothetical protein